MKCKFEIKCYYEHLHCSVLQKNVLRMDNGSLVCNKETKIFYVSIDTFNNL